MAIKTNCFLKSHVEIVIFTQNTKQSTFWTFSKSTSSKKFVVKPRFIIIIKTNTCSQDHKLGVSCIWNYAL
jgi:hypothetical protein